MWFWRYLQSCIVIVIGAFGFGFSRAYRSCTCDPTCILVPKLLGAIIYITTNLYCYILLLGLVLSLFILRPSKQCTLCTWWLVTPIWNNPSLAAPAAYSSSVSETSAFGSTKTVFLTGRVEKFLKELLKINSSQEDSQEKPMILGVSNWRK